MGGVLPFEGDAAVLMVAGGPQTLAEDLVVVFND